MRRFLLVSCAVLAGCSAPQSNNNGPYFSQNGDHGAPPPPAKMSVPEPRATADSAAGDAAAGISVSAAPGVAFNYHYAFRLPNAKIEAVQEEHAQMCEKLTLAHCRITGMRYRRVSDNEIEASLAFKLDPAVARQFGKDGIAAVNKAEGMVVDTEITGNDAGAVIEGANRDAAQARARLAEIEAQLKQPGLGARERVTLQEEVRELQTQLNGANNTRSEAQKTLATTPVEFVYGSGNLIPGFDSRSPLRDAIGVAQNSFVTMISFVLIAIGLLAPWALMGGAVYWGWKLFRKRWPRTSKMPTEGGDQI